MHGQLRVKPYFTNTNWLEGNTDVFQYLFLRALLPVPNEISAYGVIEIRMDEAQPVSVMML